MYFTSPTNSGCLNVSVAWHQQGHEVSVWWSFFVKDRWSTKTLEHLPCSTPVLKKADGPARAWLMANQETTQLLNALLAIIDPELYATGRWVMQTLREDNEVLGLHKGLEHWHSVFTAITLITNRELLLHRNPKTNVHWYDLMLTVSDYNEAILELSTFGLQLLYNPGSICFISGKLVRHGVSSIKGTRICYVYYMRESMHNFYSLLSAKWVEYDNVLGRWMHILMPNHCRHVCPSYKSFCHQNPISCRCHPYHSPGCSNPLETDLLPLGKDKGGQGIFVQCHKFKGGQRGNCVRSCKLTRYSLWCREGNQNPSLVSRYVLCSAASRTQGSDRGAQCPCPSALKDRWGDWSSLLQQHFTFRSTHWVDRLATSLWPWARPRTCLGRRHTSRSLRGFQCKRDSLVAWFHPIWGQKATHFAQTPQAQRQW